MFNSLRHISFDKIFLISIGALYLLLLFFYSDIFGSSLKFAGNIFIKILPMFVFVFFLMAAVNYFVTRKWVTRQLGGRGAKKWLFAVVSGIISTGPIYVWYPLLSDLKEKGVSNGLISCFLYTRPVKLPLLPIAIYYFGWQFVLVLVLALVAVSVIQGKIIDSLV
jgi:uncharacterized membrane protein YraQ (UPF0718 family)